MRDDGLDEAAVGAALERLRALDPDPAAVDEYWSRHAELPDATLPPRAVRLGRSVSVHIAAP